VRVDRGALIGDGPSRQSSNGRRKPAYRPLLRSRPPSVLRSGRPTRVWWIRHTWHFPLHAAGNRGARGTVDIATSSYIRTIRSLLQARAGPAAKARRQPVVALDAPDLPDLPWSVTEAEELCVHDPDATVLPPQRATVEEVTRALTGLLLGMLSCICAPITLTRPSMKPILCRRLQARCRLALEHQ
jgi:hypothetical protein